MGMNPRLWASANGTRNINQGQGGGAYLIYSNAFSPASGQAVSTRTVTKPASSTADYYHMDGLTDFRVWDLTAWGSPGSAIATAKGYRYIVFISCDHPSTGSGQESGWAYDATHVYAGFTNDPHVFPDPSTFRAIIPGNGSAMPSASGTFLQPFQCWPVYNPDDASTPFYIYTEGNQQGGGFVNSLNTVLWKNANFDSQFTAVGVSHAAAAGGGTPGNLGYQRVYRLGTGSWVSWGFGNEDGFTGTHNKFTSSDGLTFTKGAAYVRQVNSSGTGVTGAVNNGWQKSCGLMGERFQIGSDWYVPVTEDLRGPGWSSGTTYAANEQVNVSQRTYRSIAGSNLNNPPASSPVQWTDLGFLGQYVSLVPVDSTTGDLNFTGSPAIIRVSSVYSGIYPDATYLQYVTNYVENGIVTLYAVHGFFGDTGLSSGYLPENGGGLNEQFVDVYAYVFDASAATASAPLNVQSSCSSGVVTLTWADLPAGRSYRIKRGTDGVTFGTTVSSSLAGTSITDSPTVGSVYYYQVISLHGGTEQASRVVKTYVS